MTVWDTCSDCCYWSTSHYVAVMHFSLLIKLNDFPWGIHYLPWSPKCVSVKQINEKSAAAERLSWKQGALPFQLWTISKVKCQWGHGKNTINAQSLCDDLNSSTNINVKHMLRRAHGTKLHWLLIELYFLSVLLKSANCKAEARKREVNKAFSLQVMKYVRFCTKRMMAGFTFFLSG